MIHRQRFYTYRCPEDVNKFIETMKIKREDIITITDEERYVTLWYWKNK